MITKGSVDMPAKARQFALGQKVSLSTLYSSGTALNGGATTGDRCTEGQKKMIKRQCTQPTFQRLDICRPVPVNLLCRNLRPDELCISPGAASVRKKLPRGDAADILVRVPSGRCHIRQAGAAEL